MIRYHAVMVDETGCEFGATFEAKDRNQAFHYVYENYPESRCVQMESPEDTAKREQDTYDRMSAELDDDGWDFEEGYE